MSDVVIRARDLRKVYRLYAKPHYRFLDMFGLLGRKAHAYTEHSALDGVTLDIRRGEKVAIIGRNGAGKSTFLKLITRVVEPTSGTLAVGGHVHALLQIGTGFHPDFSGRQNVYAYLAQLGVTGAAAEARVAEIVEFAEIEEYIDQPVKTYSTGMAVRLMFSTATAITPELLVLDEVLGVGDAYFSQKSYERILELCEQSGTTLLLVTHDVYSAIKVCSRVIWIDRGRVVMDDAGPTVVKAYEDSIRAQEEARLRAKALQRIRRISSSASSVDHGMLIEIRSRDGRPHPEAVYFSRIAVTVDGREVARLPLGQEAFDASRPSHLQAEGGNWGEPTLWEGRAARPLKNYGSPFHKVSGVLAIDRAASARGTLVIDFWCAAPPALVVDAYADGQAALLGHVHGAAGTWQTVECPLDNVSWSDAGTDLGVNATGRHGSGALVVNDVRVLDGNGALTFQVVHGQPMTMEIDYELRDPDFLERPQIIVAWQRDGIQDVCRWISRDLVIDSRQGRDGTVRLRVPRLLLADGEYAVTVLVAREGYYDRTQVLFYTMNPDVYFCVSRLFNVAVTGAGLIGSGTVVVAEGEWEAAR